MKRFWDRAFPVEESGAWHILLDGQPLRLPGGALLRLPNAALGAAVAAEWQAAGGGKDGEMGWGDVGLTRLAGTAQERIAPDAAPTVAALARYAETDLLCYRATHPEDLVARQALAWQPHLDWAAAALDATLRVTAGIVPIAQDPAALRAIHAAFAAHDPWTLAGLGVIVPALGSAVLGLALAAGRIDAAAAHAAASLDELWQAELWGEDAEAAARRAAVAADIASAARLMSLSRT